MASTQSKEKKPFRVIVVGGGVVGLTMAHALRLANIDHVVLEKHKDVTSLHGAAIMIWPAVARIFDQFGFLDKVQEAATPVSAEYKRWPDGSVNFIGSNVQALNSKFGLTTIVMDRERLVRYLYENVDDDSRIQTNKRVERVEYLEDGVRVHLTDGTIEEGDIVVGADGVHSTIKQQMWDWAAKNDPEAIPDSEKSVVYSDFAGFFGVSEMQDGWGLGPGDIHIILGHNHTKLLFTQPGKAMWALIYKQPHSSPPKPLDKNPEVVEAVARSFADSQFTETLTFGDLWAHQTRFGHLNIEEGIQKKWHAGRTVLVGDSAHKMTADLGMGANVAIESAIVLCNILHRELKDNPNRHPSVPELTAMFAEYQKERFPRANAWYEFSGKATRMNSYQTLYQRFMAGYIMPLLHEKQKALMATNFANSIKLDYVPTKTVDESVGGWLLKKSKEELEREKRARERGSTPWVSVMLLTSTIGVTVAFAAQNGYLKGLPALLASK